MQLASMAFLCYICNKKLEAALNRVCFCVEHVLNFRFRKPMLYLLQIEKSTPYKKLFVISARRAS